MAATPVYIREEQFSIQVHVNGINFPPALTSGSWQSKEGGDVTAEVVQTHPGGMAGEIALGGIGKRSDATVKTLYTEDLHALVPALESACGNARMSIGWTPLDANGFPTVGATTTITGFMKGCVVPNYDANTNAAGMLEIVCGCDQHQQGAGS
jgi:hypothetical protein